MELFLRYSLYLMHLQRGVRGARPYLGGDASN